MKEKLFIVIYDDSDCINIPMARDPVGCRVLFGLVSVMVITCGEMYHSVALVALGLIGLSAALWVSGFAQNLNGLLDKNPCAKRNKDTKVVELDLSK